MSKNWPYPPKSAILDLLHREQEPVSLQYLLGKLGKDFSERSVRRWIGEMIKEGLIEREGVKRGTKYRIKYRQQEYTQCFSDESKKIISYLKRPLQERKPVTYDYEWFNSYQPNKSSYISEALKSQLFTTGKRSKDEEPAGTYAHQIFNRLLIDLSYNSSRYEKTFTRGNGSRG